MIGTLIFGWSVVAGLVLFALWPIALQALLIYVIGRATRQIIGYYAEWRSWRGPRIPRATINVGKRR